MDISKELSDTSATLYVLSCLMHKPELLEEDKYPLVQTDFCKNLEQILFTTVFNLEKQGAAHLTPSDVDLFLKTQPSMYAYYQNNKGYEWLMTVYQLTETFDRGQFDFYYDRLKKFSILRDLYKNGVDIKEFYDVDKDFLDRDEEDDKLNKIKRDEIINRVREKLAGIESKHVGKINDKSQNAAKGLRALIESFADNPDIGMPIDGEIYNFASSGARLGKFYLYSSSSGGGKTRHLVGNACSLAFPRIEGGKIVGKDGLQKVLFIETEMTADELQTLLVAYVSGVNERKITKHTMNEQEKKNVDLAISIIEQYADNFLIEQVTDPNVNMLKTLCVKYILQENVQYIFYDYIGTSVGLLTEFRDLKTREDVALMLMSNTLKNVAADYQTFVESATQLSGEYEGAIIRDQTNIRGSKAVADKIDFGAIGIKLIKDSEEYMAVAPIIEKLGLPYTPNLVIDIYKNRRGEIVVAKLFRYFDFGTCRAYDLFLTDSSYKQWADDEGNTNCRIKTEQHIFEDMEKMKEFYHE